MSRIEIFFNALPHLYVLIDREDRVVAVTDRFLSQFNLGRGEVLRQHLGKTLAPLGPAVHAGCAGLLSRCRASERFLTCLFADWRVTCGRNGTHLLLSFDAFAPDRVVSELFSSLGTIMGDVDMLRREPDPERKESRLQHIQKVGGRALRLISHLYQT